MSYHFLLTNQYESNIIGASFYFTFGNKKIIIEVFDMKKMFKKIAAVILSAAMLATCALSLTSCGGLFEEESFKIGATGPLTEEAASYGISVQNGAKLAVKHLNEKEGGVKFSFAILDDKAGAEDASTNYDTLYDAGMQFSLGGVTSGAGEAFAKKANTDKIFCMTPSGSADPVITDLKYSFRLCFGDPDQGALAAEEIKDGGFKNVGAIYDESDSYSAGIYAAFKDKMAELEITYIETKFDKENNKDFSTQAETLKDCDVVFMPFYYTEASLFINKAVEKGSDAMFFGCDGFDGIADLVADVENTIKYITPFDAKSEEANVKAFVEAYKAEYGATPDQFAADAYDVVMVLAAALNKAGVTDYALSAAEIGDILYDTITSDSFSYDGLTGADMTWDESGKCTKAPKIVTLGE